MTGFGKLDPNVLANTAHLVAKGVGGNPQYFGNPPVAPAALGASATTRSAAILATMDGGKNAKTIHEKQRKMVIQDLNLLAVYVQNVSNDDPAIFAASGFTAKPTGKSAPQPVGAPTFRSLDYGVNSGQIVVSVKAQAGAKSYFIRYAVMAGATPGAWTTNPGSPHSEADHDLRSDTNHDLRVPGAGSGRARLFRLECDHDDHLHLVCF